VNALINFYPCFNQIPKATVAFSRMDIVSGSASFEVSIIQISSCNMVLRFYAWNNAHVGSTTVQWQAYTNWFTYQNLNLGLLFFIDNYFCEVLEKELRNWCCLLTIIVNKINDH
jgi:hypothetical protein